MRAAAALSVCLMLAGAQLASAAEPGCASADAKRIGRNACVEIEAKAAQDDLTLDRSEAMTPEKRREYCPNVILSAAGLRKRVTLPDATFLYDESNCCPATELTLDADPKTRRFTLRGVGRDCFGGTARFDLEEVYQLESSGAATLIRRTDRSTDLTPKPE